jgi:hypothetical protein
MHHDSEVLRVIAMIDIVPVYFVQMKIFSMLFFEDD